MSTSILMPKLGLTMKEGTVVEWLKRPGDTITAGEGIATISSEKLTSEVEAPASGTLLKVVADVDEEIEVGGVIGIIGEAEIVEDVPEQEPNYINNQAERPENGQIRISPAARKKAKELGVDPNHVTGTGPRGRITRGDIETFAKEQKQQLSVQVEVVEKVERAEQVEQAPIIVSEPDTNLGNLSTMRSTIAKRMHVSLTSTAQLTLHRKANIDKLLEFQNNIRNEASNSKLDIKLTLTVLLSRAVTLSLRDKPYMNTHLIDNKLHQHTEVNLGIATALDEGLVVPVVRNAEKLPLGELATAISQVTEKARNGKASGSEISGSTFTITNLGSQGIEYFTPILNTPESGILGVGIFLDELKLEDGEVIQVKKLPLSLTFDHRVIDGAPAAEFLAQVIHYLENPYLLVL